MDIDIDELRSWIGRSQLQHETLTPALIDRFNATFDRTGPSEPGTDAPLLIHLCLCQPAAATAALGDDGHPARGGFLPPVPLPRRMWAGGVFEFHAAPRSGETITRRSTIADVTLKEGRSGRLCFITVAHELSADGRALVTERQDIVYRDPPGGPSSGTSPAPVRAPQGQQVRTIRPDPVLLFRYSALTFNGHRIHYDRPYATGEEGYPGLVVHGPLQATLLAQFATDLRGVPPHRFSFRSLSPIHDTGRFTLNASESGGGLDLWTAAADGPVAMEARAEW
ncbi:FAS1-like dehydratase domain-containing protein [Frigidibacter oleivorans]|uniref:FAS1-like dehydratase domain-containing protein n=1 Tax=Frigidibacter oleivorans TaxID=2487129 RepID=UPI000F8F6D50|nr:MaoC family dehydratase N-terminal domain-containing protein [Frigidibacter oleivorans]